MPRQCYEVNRGMYENHYLVGYFRTLDEAKSAIPDQSWTREYIPAGCVGHENVTWLNGKDWDAYAEINEIDEPEWLTKYLTGED